MRRNEKLRTRITAILLAFVMAASLLVAGIGVGADVKAATEKTVKVIYTGTADAELYLDGYQANSYQDTWELVSDNSNFTYEETTDENGFTVYSVSFDFSSIYSVEFKLSVGWTWFKFSWDDINNGDTTKYVYADGTIGTEAPEIEEEPTPVIGTTTFVYAGTGSYSASAINFWVTDLCANGAWTTANSNISSLSSEYTVTTEATTYNEMPAVIVSADTNVCTELYANIWVDGSSISKNGNQITFDGSVYYIYDDSTITTEAPSTDEGEGEGEGEGEEVTPVIGTTTFVYAGDGSYSAAAIGFWATDLCANGSWVNVNTNINSISSEYTVTAETTTYNEMPAVIVSADTNICTELYANIWIDGTSISKEGNQITFDGTVYYIYDDSTITTEAPSTDEGEGEEEDTTKNEYTVTVNVYGEAATIGAGFANESAQLWSSYWKQDAALNGDWATTVFTLKDEKVYTDFEAQIVVGDEWTSPKYTMTLSNNSATMWIVPEAGTCFDNEADALAAAADPATSSKVIVHYKTNAVAAWVVGSWFTTEINGSWGTKDTVFSYQDDWGYIAVVEYDEVVNSLGFKLHQKWNIDGVNYDWYREDGDNRVISLSNGFAEVWLTKGSSTVSYTCPKGATVFDEATATPFKNYRYVGRQSAKGEDAELVFHYLREDGVYDEWQVGIWAQAANNTWKNEQISQNKELDEYGAATYTVDLSKWPKTEIGFAVNYNNWEKKDYAADRYVDVSKVKAGEVLDVYLYENDGKIYFEPKTDVVSETDAGLDADAVFHYSRTNGDYEGWMVGLWCEMADGTWVNDNVAFDGTDADGFATVTVDLSKFPAESLGFKINKDEWASEDGGDRFIDLTELTDGQIIDVYIYEGDGEVYFEPQVEEEPVEVVTETDIVEEPVEEPEEETKGGCAGCTGCTGCAMLLPVFAIIIAGAIFIFKKRA